MSRPRTLGFEIGFATLALAMVVPLLRVAHPPIQDLPQHLATIRAIADFADPTLRFADTYVLELGRTQYLSYYLLAALLSKALGVVAANRLVLCAALVGTPYALRFLLRELEADERGAVLALPLTWNAHLILGFVNFVAGIPLAFLCLGLAARARKDGLPRQLVGLAALLVLTFTTHVVPFGFALLGSALILPGDGVRESVRRGLALVPSALAMAVWAKASPAGQATVTAARGDGGGGPEPVFLSAADSLAQLPNWLTDVLHVPDDERLLAAFGVLLLTAVTLGGDAGAPRPAVARARLVVGLLGPLAAAGYFVAPESYDWIWPIKARFPLLALYFLVASLRLPRGLPGHGLVLAAGLVAALSARAVDTAFHAFEAEEVVGLEEAIADIPPGERVVGLIYDKGSHHVKFSPFLHTVAYYQAARGGAVMFSFADFPQSPLRFREDVRPPRVGPRWEWMPERVRPEEELGFYTYAITRGGPGAIGGAPSFERVGLHGRFQVWRRKAAAPAAGGSAAPAP